MPPEADVRVRQEPRERPSVWWAIEPVAYSPVREEDGRVAIGHYQPITADNARELVRHLRALAADVERVAHRIPQPWDPYDVLVHLHGEVAVDSLADEPWGAPWCVDDYGDVWYARDGWGWTEMWRGE